MSNAEIETLYIIDSYNEMDTAPFGMPLAEFIHCTICPAVL